MAVKRLEQTNNTLKIKTSNLKIFLKNIQDLTKIDEKVHIFFDNDNILMYSYAGVESEREARVHAFKSHVMKTDDVFFKVQKPFLEKTTFIIIEGKKFVKNINNFIDFEEDIDMKMTYNENAFISKMTVKNKQLKLDVIGGDMSSIKVDIDVDTIEETMNTEYSSFSFNLSHMQFDKIKKMSAIDRDKDKSNDIFYLNVLERVVSMGENKWNLKIDTLEDDEYEGHSASFPKKYFNSINFTGEDSMKVHVFDEFLLVTSEFTNLMILVEEYA